MCVPPADSQDTLQLDDPLLAELCSASISGCVATGPRAGRPIVRVGEEIDSENAESKSGNCCAMVEGFSVHAGVRVPARDRLRLERLLRYASRGPISNERLSLLPDGRLCYKLKRRWKDGTKAVIYEPMELMERLAALVPPPRFNIVRYYGVLAPASSLRRYIVPQDKSEIEPAHPGCLAKAEASAAEEAEANPKRSKKPRNYSWAQLLKQVFEVDILICLGCGSKMRVLCAIHPPDVIQKILTCLGLPSRAPPIAPARPGVVEDRLFW
jgi:Putative transposase